MTASCGHLGRCEAGQATVEFAVVAAAFLAILVALGALLKAVEGGMFVAHVLSSASHHVQLTMPGGIADVFLY